MNKINNVIYRVEQIFTSVILAAMATLIFISAITRKFGLPINWTQDVSLLGFAWLTFIGGDFLMRSGKLINIDMLVKHFPFMVQKFLTIIFDILMLVFLGILIRYGFPLVNGSWNRVFNTLPISYAWCTLCVPVGSVLMFFTTVQILVRDIKKKEGDE